MYKYILALFLVTSSAFADRPQRVTTVTNVSNYADTVGVASAIAHAQHQFDWGTYSYQGSVGVGIFNSREAVSVAFGKRFTKKGGLLNASLSLEDGKVGIGVGYNWRF